MTRNLGKYIFLIAATMKAAVVGASLGIAAFGAMDFTFAISASEWLEAAREEYLFEYFTLGGGVAGAVIQVLSRA